jgi:hypothetical protein
MKYILLIHHVEVLDEDERQQLLEESVQLANQLHEKRQYFDAAPLHPTSATMSVKVRDGKRIVTDGPFAETREQIGGYFLIDAQNIEEAIDIAGRIPGARIGTVEVRPVRELQGLPADQGARGKIRNREPTGIVNGKSMQLESQPALVSKKKLWAGRIVSALPILFLLMDGVMKFVGPPIVVETTVQLGYPASVILPIGIVLLLSTVLYLIPRTAILGAILLTGYLGGAVATHVRVGAGLFPVLFPVIIGGLLWLGLYLRDDQLRRLLPLRTNY